jgi:Zn-dependent metalloprotease
VHAIQGDSFRSRGVVLDRDGSSHVRYDRTYRGLPVLGGDVVVHLTPSGALRDVSQSLTRPVQVATTPGISRARATAVAVPRLAWEGHRHRHRHLLRPGFDRHELQQQHRPV